MVIKKSKLNKRNRAEKKKKTKAKWNQIIWSSRTTRQSRWQSDWLCRERWVICIRLSIFYCLLLLGAFFQPLNVRWKESERDLSFNHSHPSSRKSFIFMIFCKKFTFIFIYFFAFLFRDSRKVCNHPKSYRCFVQKIFGSGRI